MPFYQEVMIFVLFDTLDGNGALLCLSVLSDIPVLHILNSNLDENIAIDSIIQKHLLFICFPHGLFSFLFLTFFLVMLSVVITTIVSYLNVTFPDCNCIGCSSSSTPNFHTNQKW